MIVTRHKALVQYLLEQGIGSARTRVIEHATEDDVRGNCVIGVLPLHLAALAVSVVEVPLDVPAHRRGAELTLEEVRSYARPARVYEVRSSIAWPTEWRRERT